MNNLDIYPRSPQVNHSITQYIYTLYIFFQRWCLVWSCVNYYLFSCCVSEYPYLARSAKVAERAICFTDRNFYLSFIFFNDFSETNFLKIRWTDFRSLYIKWKLFGCRWSIWTCFFDMSRDVAMATDFVQNGAKLPTPLHLSLCQSKMEWDIATSMGALTAQMMPVYYVKISWNSVQ